MDALARRLPDAALPFNPAAHQSCEAIMTNKPDASGPDTSRTAPDSPERVERAQVIALVDDDRNILTTVSIALQAEGFATRVYYDGAAALPALLDNPPDLVVCDYQNAAHGWLRLVEPVARNQRIAGDFPDQQG